MSEATRAPGGTELRPGTVRFALQRIGSLFQLLELDTRLLGMIGALIVIWVGFNIMSEGSFLTPRNLWNLSVQTSSIAIMATGMVLIIVSRNIDLSVGSMLGLVGYTMALVQTIWIPTYLGFGHGQPWIWIVALAVGIILGALIGAFQGSIVAYGGVPSFIVTLGGLLIWRGLIFRLGQQGQTITPTDSTFHLIGGGPIGSIGGVPSWIVGIVACVAIVYLLVSSRRRRQKYGFPVRPVWAAVTLGVVGCAIVLGAVWVANSYPWPPALATRYAVEHNITEPPGGLIIPTGIAYPVLIMIGVTIVMTYMATRRRFGRYVYAIGGNPDAAELGGINVKRTIVSTYMVIGILVAISAAIQVGRLNGAVTGLGVQNELDVIAAAVIGGTSFAGGIGTIPGAILGAVVMQSLRSGMLLLNVDSPTQDIVLGIVLVGAVGLDAVLRRRTSR
ncbi:MAG TPA: sugar ABC transporter permease [Candidatus Polarisedimenticolia bacterium]|nr:sugar ABC transporter permease [Candidatus Polarisedimenticolia bacterium]